MEVPHTPSDRYSLKMLRSNRDTAQLRQRLWGFQIFFIVISGVVGSGLFSGNGQALELAGPGGLLLAVLVLGFIGAFVGETISELTQLFPVPNAMFHYVKSFVDEDLAWIVGWLYWYTYASTFAAQMLGAAKLLHYWNPATVWPPMIFYFIMPAFLFLLNLLWVDAFGWVETAGGLLKLLITVGIILAMYNVSSTGESIGNIGDGFKFDVEYASSAARAFCYAFPLVAYGYLGIESTAVAAFEAASISEPRPARRTALSMARATLRPLPPATRFIHWVVLGLYLLCTLGIALTVPWADPRLPPIYGSIATASNGTSDDAAPPNPNSSSAVVLAVWTTRPGLAGFINGCLVFSIISAANTALYIASRTLYGLTYNLEGRHYFSAFAKKHIGVVWKTTGVPARALLISLMAFWWLLPMQMGSSVGIDMVIEIVSLSSSMSCVIVWAIICLAYHRFHYWTTRSERGLIDHDMERYLPDSDRYGAWTLLSWLRPWFARAGLGGCFLIFIFASATWWDTPVSGAKFTSAYGVHIVALAAWLIMKLRNGTKDVEWFVPIVINGSARVLRQKLRDLEDLTARSADRTRTVYSPLAPLAWGDEGGGSRDQVAEPRAHNNDNDNEIDMGSGGGGDYEGPPAPVANAYARQHLERDLDMDGHQQQGLDGRPRSFASGHGASGSASLVRSQGLGNEVGQE